jgi:hypothetical protein
MCEKDHLLDGGSKHYAQCQNWSRWTQRKTTAEREKREREAEKTKYVEKTNKKTELK